MERDEVKELHFITSMVNLGSILQRGILSYDRAARIAHNSCASEEVQARRQRIRVPNGGRLHSYVNLYFHARNPMMYVLTRQHQRDDLIVIRISQTVLDLPDTVLADGNAAADGTHFLPSPEGLGYLKSELIFAKYWTDADFWPAQEKKRVRNAEVLVPNMVASEYIEGCYVDTQEKRSYCQRIERLPSVTIHREIFFR